MEAKHRRGFSHQKVLAPYSNRRLYHPSFMSLYSDPITRHHGESQTVHPMVPQEFFYTDPTMVCGTRIANHVNEMRDFECFQLNTPPPIMSAYPAPPNCSDPFRTGRHLTRNLGCSSWEMGLKPPPANHMWAVIQLTQEEDQTITNLLKLHYGEGKIVQSEVEELHLDRFSSASHTSSDQANEQMSRDCAYSREAGLGKFRKHWSDTELEVANTLLTHFSATSDESCVKSDRSDNEFFSDRKRNMKDLTDFPSIDRVLSTSEGEALCGLLNLGLVQT